MLIGSISRDSDSCRQEDASTGLKKIRNASGTGTVWICMGPLLCQSQLPTAALTQARSAASRDTASQRTARRSIAVSSTTACAQRPQRAQAPESMSQLVVNPPTWSGRWCLQPRYCGVGKGPCPIASPASSSPGLSGLPEPCTCYRSAHKVWFFASLQCVIKVASVSYFWLIGIGVRSFLSLHCLRAQSGLLVPASLNAEPNFQSCSLLSIPSSRMQSCLILKLDR